MWYIFKADKCLASCDFEPNAEDLATRGEIAVKDVDLYNLTGIKLIDGVIVVKENSSEEARNAKLQQVDTWTATAITSGFTSATTGIVATYDSTEADQQNIMLMLQAAQNANFATHPVYKGKIPIRAVPEGQFIKVVLQHNAAQMQQLVIDMALHIGACKQTGWKLQEEAAAAKTIEEILAIKWPE